MMKLYLFVLYTAVNLVGASLKGSDLKDLFLSHSLSKFKDSITALDTSFTSLKNRRDIQVNLREAVIQARDALTRSDFILEGIFSNVGEEGGFVSRAVTHMNSPTFTIESVAYASRKWYVAVTDLADLKARVKNSKDVARFSMSIDSVLLSINRIKDG